jgi:putative ABC transport system substrate-binding protein
MDRRRFLLTSLAGVIGAPLAAVAQQTGRSHRIGILGNVPPTQPNGALLWGAFNQGLRDHGYTEGQNLSIEQLYSEGKYERLVGLADKLVGRRVEVIVVPADQNALGSPAGHAAIPIVMIGDRVGSGLVASLARPGGNITGLAGIVGPEIVGKQLELLKASPAVPCRHPSESGEPFARGPRERGGQRRPVDDAGASDGPQPGPAQRAMRGGSTTSR